MPVAASVTHDPSVGRTSRRYQCRHNPRVNRRSLRPRRPRLRPATTTYRPTSSNMPQRTGSYDRLVHEGAVRLSASARLRCRLVERCRSVADHASTNPPPVNDAPSAQFCVQPSLVVSRYRVQDRTPSLCYAGPMCNLYTLAPWEVRNLIRHYTLIGRDFEEVMRGRSLQLGRSLRRCGLVPLFHGHAFKSVIPRGGSTEDTTIFSAATPARSSAGR